MRLLSLDPGTVRIGWAVLDIHDGIRELIEYGVLTAHASKSVSARIHDLWKQLTVLRKRVNPDEAAIEEAFYHQNVQTTMRLAEARGACFVALAGMPIHQCNNATVKKAVVGRGNAKKEQTAARVRKVMKIPGGASLPEDAADAIAVGLYWCQVSLRKQGGLF